MSTIWARYKASDGRLRRGHQIHINDNGRPLCGDRVRQGFNVAHPDKWVIGSDEPTCVVCIRMQKRLKPNT